MFKLLVVLFINKEIKSKEGTTQWDPTSMGAYVPGVTPLLHFWHQLTIVNEHECKEVAFAGDFSVAGKIKRSKQIGKWYNK